MYPTVLVVVSARVRVGGGNWQTWRRWQFLFDDGSVMESGVPIGGIVAIRHVSVLKMDSKNKSLYFIRNSNSITIFPHGRGLSC